MSNDIGQTGLREPERTDWDTAYSGSKYQAPPVTEGPDGKSITFYGKVVEAKLAENSDDGYLNYQIDIKVTGNEDARPLRAWVSTKPFMKRNASGELEPMKGNPNSLARFLRSAGLQAKPQTNSEYIASVKAVNGHQIPFTADWEARNKDTGEVVRGFRAFPLNPDGTRKTILKAGDTVNEVDKKGNITGTRTVTSEVLFANLRVKYFQDPTPSVSGSGQGR